MKRLFCIFASVLMIASCLVTSAFAASTHYYYGDILLPNIDSVWNQDQYSRALIYKQSDTEYWLVTFKRDPTVASNVDVGTHEVYKVTLPDGEWKYFDTFSTSYLSSSNIKWTSETIYRSDGSVLKEASSPSEPICDGSSCPASDVNSDGICDDCGRVLRLLNTPTSYPTLPVVEGDNLNSVLIKDSVGYKYYVTYSENEYTITGSHSTIFRANMSRVVPFEVYTYEDGDLDWVLNNRSSGSSMMLGNADVVTLISSTFDWIDSETGDLFFPVPLWAEVDQVTQGEMTGLGQTMGGILKVLVPCGVGLMALLAVLSLFGKRSLLFLKR